VTRAVVQARGAVVGIACLPEIVQAGGGRSPIGDTVGKQRCMLLGIAGRFQELPEQGDIRGIEVNPPHLVLDGDRQRLSAKAESLRRPISAPALFQPCIRNAKYRPDDRRIESRIVNRCDHGSVFVERSLIGQGLRGTEQQGQNGYDPKDRDERPAALVVVSGAATAHG